MNGFTLSFDNASGGVLHLPERVRVTLLALGEEFFHVPFVVVIKIICLASALVILVVRRAIIRHLCLGLLSVSILGMTLVSVGKFRLFL